MAKKDIILASLNHWRNDHKLLTLFGGDKRFNAVFGGHTCACCTAYRTPDSCAGCPVAEETGKSGCTVVGAPWNKARMAYGDNDVSLFLEAQTELVTALERAYAKEVAKEVANEAKFEVGKVYMYRPDESMLRVFRVTEYSSSSYVTCEELYAEGPAWAMCTDRKGFYRGSDMWRYSVPFYAPDMDDTPGYMTGYMIVGVRVPFYEPYISADGYVTHHVDTLDTSRYAGLRYILRELTPKPERKVESSSRFVVGSAYVYRNDTDVLAFLVDEVYDRTVVYTKIYSSLPRSGCSFGADGMIWRTAVPFYAPEQQALNGYKIVDIARPAPKQRFINRFGRIGFLHPGECVPDEYDGLRYIVAPVHCRYDVDAVYLYTDTEQGFMVYRVTGVRDQKQWVDIRILDASLEYCGISGFGVVDSAMWADSVPFVAPPKNLGDYKVVGVGIPTAGTMYWNDVSGTVTEAREDHVTGYQYIVERTEQKFKVGKVYLYYTQADGVMVFRVTEVSDHGWVSYDAIFKSWIPWKDYSFCVGSGVYRDSVPFYDIEDNSILEKYKIVGIGVPSVRLFISANGKNVYTHTEDVELQCFKGLRYLVEPLRMRQKFEVGKTYLYRSGAVVFRVTGIKGDEISYENVYDGHSRPGLNCYFVKDSFMWEESIPFYVVDKSVLDDYDIVDIRVPVPGDEFVGSLYGKMILLASPDPRKITEDDYAGIRYIVTPKVKTVERRISDLERRVTELESIH